MESKVKTYKAYNRIHKLRDKGFTLVELIVTMVVFSIMITLVGLGMLAWQDWTDFKNQNEYAQTLFIAAQNQLSEYNSNGRLKEMQKEFADSHAGIGTKLDITTLIDDSGNFYNPDIVWPDSKNETDPEKYRRDIYSLKADAGEYEKYLNDPVSYKASNPEQFWLFELVGPYVQDNTVLNNAAICIEFTPDEGQVFSVLYSSKNTSFEYNQLNKETRGKVDITNREESYRNERMVGYYGVDILSMSSKPEGIPELVNAHIYNEDVCYLSFAIEPTSVKKDYRYVRQITYDIDVVGKETGKKKFRITVDGNLLPDNGTEKVANCDVALYDDDSNLLSPSPMPVVLRLKDTWTIEVVLDAADIQAQTPLYKSFIKKEAAGADFARTYSYFRFGTDTENIVCTIKGRVDGTKYTEPVYTDNNENPVFASGQASSGNYSYEIANGRHLYNVRYIEDIGYDLQSSLGYGTVAKVDFTVKNSIDWHQFQKTGNLYSSAINYINLGSLSKDRTNCDFPSIMQLRSQDTFKGDGKVFISGINLSLASNTLYKLYRSMPDGAKPTGLFVENRGTIANLGLSKENVTGNQFTAGLVAFNAGNVSNIENDSECLISGSDYVGGIIALQLPKASPVTVTKLNNKAEVTGDKAVGGVVSAVRNNFTDFSLAAKGLSTEAVSAIPASPAVLTITDCSNEGIVSAKENNSMYIGGIAGYCYSKNAGDNLIIIDNCKSASAVKDVTIADIAASNKTDRLKGIYVGGITGYNYGAKIADCTSLEGLLLGNEYVGGIVGLNLGAIGDNNEAANLSNVAGKKYVGGITACNAKMLKYENGSAADASLDPEKMAANVLAPDKSVNLNYNVKNWTNKGVVLATDSYAGGITGFNTGWIYGCKNEANAEAYLASVNYGKYIGGIAGYSNGIIGNTSRTINAAGTAGTKGTAGSDISVITYVKGQNYVGGIVGYNDINSVIENYKVTGGKVIGTDNSCFIGGFAGLNASSHLLMDSDSSTANVIASNPSQVTGTYCVGGTIGGNIISIAVSEQDDEDKPGGQPVDIPATIVAEFIPDAFTGELTGHAFTGGLIGYNLLAENASEEVIYNIQNQIVTDLVASGSDLDKIVALDTIKEKVAYSSTVEIFEIAGKEPTGSGAAINAAIYAGGVIGYNDSNTHIIIKNVTNVSSINANSSVASGERINNKNYANTDTTFTYSYAGGIVGKNTTYSVLNNCANGDGITIASAGTYHGALTEVNQGTIINATVKSFGGEDSDYVGGICGINKAGAKISDCSYTSGTITGRNVVGGIAAENFGSISKININGATVIAKGNGSDGVAGLYAAYNAGDINLSSNVNGNVNSLGHYAGIVTGYNSGKLFNANETPNSNHIIISGSVTGSAVVGGLTGYNNASNPIQYFDVAATVTASDGEAGGIVADNANNEAKVEYCNGKKEASVNGKVNVGGIIAINRGPVNYCDYDGKMTGEGNVGGIAGINKGNIDSSHFSGNITAKENVGGIAGYNEGSLTSVHIGVSDSASIECSEGYVGGLVGYNTGSIAGDDYAANANHSVSITGEGNCFAGGLAGYSNKAINGNSSARVSSSYRWTIKVDNAANGSAAGGMIGYYKSDSELKYIRNLATIEASGSNECYAGGVVGVVDSSGNVTISNADHTTWIGHGTGKVRSDHYAGAIVGKIDSSVDTITISSCYRVGDVSGNSYDLLKYIGKNESNKIPIIR